jgi:F-type H+-transporting ATPase subunit a
MVFSNKPVQFLIVALVASIPLLDLQPVIDRGLPAVNEAVVPITKQVLMKRKNSMLPELINDHIETT